MIIKKTFSMNATIFNIQKFSLHDGAGIRTTVFFSGCNLRCRWCCNPDCFSPEKHDSCTIDRLLEEVLKDKVFYDKSGGGVTLSGGEIFLQFDFVREFCRILRERQVHIAVETAGCVPNEMFMELLNLVDFVFIDLKHYDARRHLEGTGVSNELILRNIASLTKSSVPCCVRIPVIPGFNDALEDAENYAAVFRELGVGNFELLPFHQFGEKKYQNLGLQYFYQGVRALHDEELTAYRRILEEKS